MMLDHNFMYLGTSYYDFRKAYPNLHKTVKTRMGQGEMNHGQNGLTLKKGIALFNAGDYFHAHEIWEDWWRATTRPEKRTIQGMIQVAVAMHHAGTRNIAGAISVMERALRNLEDAGEIWRGINLQSLRADLRCVLQQLKNGKAISPVKIELSGP